MHMLKAVVLLASVTTAQALGGCTLTRIDELMKFSGTGLRAPYATNVLECAKNCYKSFRCNALIFDNKCLMYAVPGNEPFLHLNNSSRPIGYTLKRRATPACKKVELI
ncbi:hypothetical protein Y032_0718g1797 [Ancylostoma ceylanicum]|nr:hypothetical protein Y032_0718g1797 [Ancylostoma ceylanicum]